MQLHLHVYMHRRVPYVSSHIRVRMKFPATRNKQIGQNVQLAQMHENFEHTNWTIADERRALVQVGV